jgi:hypothetical protein
MGLGNKGGISLPPIMGGLDPFQQALTDFTLGQNQTRTGDIYARLGLDPSTMETQDKAGNQLASLAQASGLEQQNIQNQLQENQLSLQAQQANNAAQAQLGSSLGSLAGGLAKLA